jgi:hypothetical protein
MKGIFKRVLFVKKFTKDAKETMVEADIQMHV